MALAFVMPKKNIELPDIRVSLDFASSTLIRRPTLIPRSPPSQNFQGGKDRLTKKKINSGSAFKGPFFWQPFWNEN